MEYQICTRCIMDNKSEPLITFDENGVCNHCHDFDARVNALPKTGEEKACFPSWELGTALVLGCASKGISCEGYNFSPC